SASRTTGTTTAATRTTTSTWSTTTSTWTTTASASRTTGPATAATRTTTAPTAAITSVATTTTVAVATRRRGSAHVGEIGTCISLGHDLALVHPTLDANAPESGTCLVEAVVDVGAHRVQRHAPIGVALCASHLSATESPGDLDLDALGAGAHGAGEGTLHGATEGDSVLQLLGDRLGYQLGIELGALDLEDVDLDLLGGHAVQVTPQGIHFGARLADHDAGPGGVDIDLEVVGVLADCDVREAGVRELAHDVLADLDVLGEILGEVALVEPVGLPVVDITHAHCLWMNLLTHVCIEVLSRCPCARA